MTARSTPATLLFLGANPSGTTSLKLDMELRLLHEEHERAPAEQGKQFRIESRPAVVVEDFRRHIARHDPVIVHFSGHGQPSAPDGSRPATAEPDVKREVMTPEGAAGEAHSTHPGELLVNDDQGRPVPVPIKAMVELFRLHRERGRVRVVVLNACHTLGLAEAIAEHVDCVIGTKRAIADDTAIAFARGFHAAIFNGKSVQNAFDAGKNEVRFKTDLGEPDDVLVLRCRGGIDPNKVLPGRDVAEQVALEAAGELHGVPELPPYYIARPDDLDKLRTLVLGESAKAAVTGRATRAGAQGMGGIGKSVLTAALARDPAVRAAFPDGVFWVVLGQTPALVSLQRQLCHALGAEREIFESATQGRSKLTELLANRASLVILDDAWDIDHVTAFGETGPKGRVLVTTRDVRILTGLDAAVHNLDVLDDTQALELLAGWAGQPVDALPDAAREAARECGNLPLALGMIGAQVRGKPDRWKNALHKLKSADLGAIKRAFPDYPYPDLLKAIQVSIDALGAADRDGYLDFAVFSEDVAVPEAVLTTFWKPRGLDEYDTQDVLDRLTGLSLLRRDASGHYRLHDLQRDYVVKAAGDAAALHGRLLEAYRAVCPSGWSSGPDDGYYFDHLTHHLKKAGRDGELRALLLDHDWLWAKLRATDVVGLLADFTHLPEDRTARLVAGAIRLSMHVLARDKEQLTSQLHGRLAGEEKPEIRSLLARAAEKQAGPWLRPLGDSLTRPGGPLLATLEGHSGPVWAVAVTADGQRAVSASKDMTLKVWDLSVPRVSRTLQAYSDWVNAVAVTPDGRRAVSGSDDKTLKVWDLSTGNVLRTLAGHSERINALAITGDGERAVSASKDMTLQVWDLSTATASRTLRGHSDWVNAVALTGDGERAVSGSDDKTLKVWDLRTGQVLRTLRGQSSGVKAVAVTADGQRAVSASSWDETLTVWDLNTGRVLRTLKGHSDRVSAVAVTRDGQRAVSASHDKTLKVWDLSTGRVLRTLEAHLDRVLAVAVTEDGRRAISASDDKTLKVWDLGVEEGPQVPDRHSGPVTAVVVTPDGKRAVSASRDKTLKVWDLSTGQVLHTLTLQGRSREDAEVAVTADGGCIVSATTDDHQLAHGDWAGTIKVWELSTGRVLRTLEDHWHGLQAVTADGRRVISQSVDHTLRVRDLPTGQVHTLQGHYDWVVGVAVAADGKLAVSKYWNSLWVWDLRTDRLLHTLEGHSGIVTTVALTSDGQRAVSGSNDKTLKVWDLSTARLLHTLEGHSGAVREVVLTSDGQRAVSGSGDTTLKVWDLSTGQALHTLEGHSGPVTEVAVPVDGQRAVSISMDWTIRAWDLRSGNCLGYFHGEAPLRRVAIAPHGRSVVAGDEQGRVHFFSL